MRPRAETQRLCSLPAGRLTPGSFPSPLGKRLLEEVREREAVHTSNLCDSVVERMEMGNSDWKNPDTT
jgi:hypothetical protein